MTQDHAIGSRYGYGSIYQRRRDGLWVAAVELPRSQGEPRRRKTHASLDRDEVTLWLAAYRADNPPIEYRGRGENMARAREKGTHTEGEWWSLVRSVRGTCYYCGSARLDFETDHKVPVCRGGSDGIDNIVVACPPCNAEKGTMTAEEYVAWKAGRQ